MCHYVMKRLRNVIILEPFSASLQKDNYFATQFHPEKSGTIGQKILENFISL